MNFEHDLVAVCLLQHIVYKAAAALTEPHSVLHRKQLIRSSFKLAQSQVLNVPILPNLTPAISVSKHELFELLLGCCNPKPFQ